MKESASQSIRKPTPLPFCQAKILRSGGSLKPDGYPNNLILTVVADDNIQVSFTSNSTNQDGYRVYIATNVNGPFTEKTTSTNKVFNLTRLTADTLYYVYTVAYKGSKESDPSNTASATTYIAKYGDVLEQMTIKPSAELSGHFNIFFKTLVTGEVDTDLDLLNIKCVETNDNREAEINWINPANKVTLQGAAPPVFNPFGGFIGTGNGYSDTGVNPTTASKFTRDSACVFFYKKTIGALDKYDWGVDDSGASANSNTHSPTFKLRYQRMNNNTYPGVDSTTISSYTGLWLHNRPDSTKYEIWQGKVKKKTHSIASSGLPNKNIFEFVMNQTTMINYSNAEHSIIGIGKSLSDAKIAILSDAVDALMNALPPLFLFDESKFLNSIVLADYTTYKARTPFSKLKFTTSSTSLYITAQPSLLTGGYGTFDYLTIYVNGILNQRVTYAVNGIKKITLPAGTDKEIIILQSTVNKPTAYQGTFITGIQSFLPITYLTNSVSEKIVFLGDSIISGFVTTNPETEGSGRLFTVENNIETAFLSYGYAAMKAFGSDAGKITAAVNNINTLFSDCTGSKKLIITLGTNDHGVDHSTAANFQTWYGDLLDAIHTSDSNIDIWCLSPILRGDVHETGLDDFRSAVDTVCATRSSYCLHIPGKPILNTGTDLSLDNVHPNITGQKKIKDAIYNVIYP